jgi:hypothetical protein
MARKSSDVNKSEEIRALLRANRKMKAKDVVATLAERGISVSEGLVYFTKGRMRGRRGRKAKMEKMASAVKNTTGGDALATLMKIKTLANDLGGLKKLKALVDALSE